MLSTTVSMWLGICFVGIGIAAVILQAWLWSFPMVPDPDGPDPNGKSTAPPFWTAVHRILGLLFVLIYVVMMIEMVPRLWEYQIELPARTVMHACMGIVIGVLLVVKIGIIRWFQHFGQSLPSIGLGILICTIILATLSIPFALQAHDFGSLSNPDNLARVQIKMASLGYTTEEAEELTSERSLGIGRGVLTQKCKMCHDMRKVLNKPRTPEKWLSMVRSMARKPTMGEPITDDDIPRVTAYLVAISPALVQSKRERTSPATPPISNEKAAKTGQTPIASGETASDDQPTKKVDVGTLTQEKTLFEERCSDCHEVDTVDEYAQEETREPWPVVVRQMIDEEEAEISDEEQAKIIQYLDARYP